jgi:hypothetical protein
MAITTYSFLFGDTLRLLNDVEWSVIEPMVHNRLKYIREYRAIHNCSLEVALEHECGGRVALHKYEEMTGIKLTHPDQIWWTRMSRYGSLCPDCDRPFRTPKAKMCAECGYILPAGQVAGPLLDIGASES